ncbi:MAG: ABC transporter ATP-binding protein [Alphaproteobacteria bacterium]
MDNTSPMKPLNIRTLLKQILQGNCKAASLLMLLQVFSGMAPVLGTWINAKLIDTIVYTTPLTKLTQGIPTVILGLILACAGFIFLEELFSSLHGFCADALKDRVYQQIKTALLTKLSSIPNLRPFADPQTQDQVTLAQQSTAMISEYVSVTSYVLMGVFGVVPALVLAASITWWIPLVILMSMVPFIWMKGNLHRKSWDIREQHAPTFKQLDVLEQILIHPNFAKEIRLHGMAPRLNARWKALFSTFFQAISTIRQRGMLGISGVALLNSLGLMACLLYVAKGTLDGQFTVGQLSFLIGILIQLRAGISSLIYNFSDILKAFWSLKPVLHILSLEDDPSSAPTLPASKTKASKQPLLCFENVSFTYPGQSKPALENISFTLDKGESLAVVGENGSGKSTLMKLICRFYEPTSGHILWKGLPLSTHPIEVTRNAMAALFQDFAQFPLSVQENLDVRNLGASKASLLEALDQVDLKATLSPHLDRTLHRAFEDGLELSGGQWQRLALARLYLLQNIELFLLDEPTSALDPNAEHRMINQIQHLMGTQTTLVISHRLALTQPADRILVLHQGRLIEQGTHKTLIQQNGAYATMFKKQASYYG